MQFLDSKKLQYVSGGCMTSLTVQRLLTDSLLASECNPHDRLNEWQHLFRDIPCYSFIRPIYYS